MGAAWCEAMMRFRPTLLAMLLLVSGLALPGAANAMRCGNELVSEGDPAYQVLRTCGEPDFVDRIGAHRHDDEEIWYYNRGSTHFVRALWFRGGILRRIETLDRGFAPGTDSPPCRPAEIRIGMTVYELLERCGEPEQRNRRHALHPFGHGRHRPPLYRQVEVEDWYYEFGGGYLARRVRLLDGRVTDVETAP